MNTKKQQPILPRAWRAAPLRPGLKASWLLEFLGTPNDVHVDMVQTRSRRMLRSTHIYVYNIYT